MIVAFDIGHTRTAAAAYRDPADFATPPVYEMAGETSAVFAAVDAQFGAGVLRVVSGSTPGLLRNVPASAGGALILDGATLGHLRGAASIETGLDRLLNVYAGFRMTGGAVLCVDVGTAITFDVGDGAGVFQGGLIVPSPETALAGLRLKAPHLPFVSPDATTPLLGLNPTEAVTAGLTHAFAALIDGTVERLRAALPYEVVVLLTGGGAWQLRPLLVGVDHTCPDLTLRGAALCAVV